MIYLYSGTPGSGKTYYAVKEMIKSIKSKKLVITNVPLNISNKDKDYYICLENDKFNAKFFYDLSFIKQFKKEGSALIVIDEAQLIFNSRNFQSRDRMKFIEFFTQHRKLGYDIILISQFDRMIDRQIRCLLEYEIKFRKVTRLLWWFPCRNLFVGVHYWYGINEKVMSIWFRLRKKYYKYYNTSTILQINSNT